MEIKTKILEQLKKQGRTQRDLAAALHTSEQSLQYYYKANLTLSKLATLAAAVGLAPWQLLHPATLAALQESGPAAPAPGLACPHCGKPIFITVTADDPGHNHGPQE